jgi:integrase
VKLLAQEDGTWHAWYEERGGNYRLVSLQTTEKELADKIALILATELGAPCSAKSSPPVETVFRDWLKEKQMEISACTLDFYRQSTRDFLTFLGPKRAIEISSIGHNDLIAYRNEIARRISAKTANHRIKTLRMAFEWAVRQRYIRESPAEFVKCLKNDAAQVRRPFTVEEIRLLLAVADPEWQSLIKFGLYTGQRIGDLVRLTWRSVNLERAVISIVTQKTKKQLHIPIAPPLLEHLKAWKKSSAPQDAPVHPKAYKALERAGGRAVTLCNHFARLLARAGLRAYKPHHIIVADGRDGKRQRNELSFHCFRHTAVTMLKEAGVPQCVVMELIGHDSAVVSQNYTHVGAAALQKACAALPEV